MNDVNVLMVGVGGHGVILASDGMAEIGMNNGYDVKKTDSLGMATHHHRRGCRSPAASSGVRRQPNSNEAPPDSSHV